MGRDHDNSGGGGGHRERRKQTIIPPAKTFCWGDGMNDKYSSSRQHFLQYARRSFSVNEKNSIENGYYTMIGVEVPPQVNDENDFNNLSFIMKRRYDNVCEEYAKAKVILMTNLSTLYFHLIEACEPTLLGKIKRHPDFTFDKADGIPCAMALMIIIQDLCSSTVGINYLPEIAMTKSDNLISNPTEFDEIEGNDYNNHEENVSNNIINEENDYNNNNEWIKVKLNNNNDDHVGSNKYDHSTKHNSDNSSEFAHTTNRYGMLWTKNDDNISVISDSDTEYDNKYNDIHSRKDNESDEKSANITGVSGKNIEHVSEKNIKHNRTNNNTTTTTTTTTQQTKSKSKIDCDITEVHSNNKNTDDVSYEMNTTDASNNSMNTNTNNSNNDNDDESTDDEFVFYFNGKKYIGRDDAHSVGDNEYSKRKRVNDDTSNGRNKQKRSDDDTTSNELTGVDNNSNTNSNSTQITGVIYELTNSDCSNNNNNPRDNEDNVSTEENENNNDNNPSEHNDTNTDPSEHNDTNTVEDNEINNNAKENETNHHNRDTDIVFDHSSRLLQCTADESITHACCGAQLTVILNRDTDNSQECGSTNNNDTSNDRSGILSTDDRIRQRTGGANNERTKGANNECTEVDNNEFNNDNGIADVNADKDNKTNSNNNQDGIRITEVMNNKTKTTRKSSTQENEDNVSNNIINIGNNIDTEIVFDHSSRLLRCTADESITHACCGAQLTVINEENAYNNHEDNVNNNTINNSDNTDDVTAMYTVDAQYNTVHHDNDNTNLSTIIERKRNNARDRHDTNRNNDVRDVNNETEVNDENDTKVNDDNDNNNNSSRNNHRKFTEKHKSY